MIAGFAGTVYARAHGLAHESLRDQLRFHAETFSGLLDVDGDGIEFEAPAGMLPEFRRVGSGSWMAIRDATGKAVVKSPSLGDGPVPDPGPWEPGGVLFSETGEGPGGIPCAMVTMSFVVDGDPAGGGTAGEAGPAPAQGRRYRVQVGLDTRGRDRGLAGLARFLWAAGGAAVLLTVGAGLLLARAVLRPVRRMTEEAAAMTPGETARRLQPDTVVRELHSLSATLNSAFDRLAEALDRQRRFTSDASHELRTPVSVLIANAEHLLRRPRTAEEYREGLLRQARTARRMKEITENLLTLARADSDSNPVEREPVRLDEVALSVSTDFQAMAEDRGLRLECEERGPVPVLGDVRYLTQLVANLVSNAVKFTPPGGRVTVHASAEDGTATLVVADTGPGIPPEHLGRILQRFYRVAGGRNEAEGAGLGLAIVDWIVKAHGGELTVESRAGEGSRFRVRLATHEG